MRIAALALVGAMLAGPVAAQVETREGIALQNQILELRQQLQQMQSNGGPSQGAPPPPYTDGAPTQPGGGGDVVAQLLVRVSTLEEQVRALQGRIEELSNQQQRQSDELGKQIGDLSFKLGQGASPAAATGPDTLSPPPGNLGAPLARPTPGAPPFRVAPPIAATPRRTPELVLKQGSASFARHDYAGAETAAREVLANSRGPRAGDAQILLARALSGQHQYKDAAASYFEVYRAAPRSPRAADALIGVSSSLLAMNDTKDACQALAKLGAEFPQAGGSVRRDAASLRRRGGCSR